MTMTTCDIPGHVRLFKESQEWRERAERAEARIAELEAGLDASERAAVQMIDRYEAVLAERGAALDLLRRFVEVETQYPADQPPVTEARAFLARVDSGTAAP
jgi:hypothetical protein